MPGFVPRDDSTQENRDYNRRQGEMLFRVFLEETMPYRIVAEDLGEVVGIVMPVDDRGDAERAHADGAPADGAAFYLEGGGKIACLVGNLGHGWGA